MSETAAGADGHDAAAENAATEAAGGAARLKKSPNAFRTISEVADDLHIPQHVLRFWETKFLQVKPMKRGGGRRYYRPADILLLRRIADLLYTQGYTIKGVQRLLREGGGQLSEDIPPATEEERSAAAAEHASGTQADEERDADADSDPPLIPGLDLGSEGLPMPRPARRRTGAETPREVQGDFRGDARGEARRLRAVLTEVLSELEAIRRLLE